MSLIPSASTIYTTAYITDKGRKYLFGVGSNSQPLRFDDEGLDTFKPEFFSMYDSDVNYRSYDKLETGDLPDLSGRKDKSCINGVMDARRQNALFYGQATQPAISFENCQIEINEGDSLDINLLLSFYLFTLYDRGVVISLDLNQTTLQPDEYFIDIQTPSNIIFPSGYNDVSFSFSSLTSNSFYVNETKSVFFNLSNFTESVPGQCTELEVVIRGTEPLPVVANFTSRLSPTSFTRGNSVAIPRETGSVTGEFYMSLNQQENYPQEPNVNLYISQTPGVNALNGGINFKIRDPQTGTIIIPDQVARVAINQGTPVPINFNSSNDNQYILIDYEVPNLGLNPGQSSSLTFAMESAFFDTEIGDYEEYVIDLITQSACGPACTTPNYVQGFSNEQNWKQLADNPFQTDNYEEVGDNLYNVQAPIVTPWLFPSSSPGTTSPAAEIKFSYSNSNKTEDLYSVFRDAIVGDNIDRVNFNESGYITPILYQDIDSSISGKHSINVTFGSYADVGGIVGSIPEERFLIDTMVYLLVRKNGQWNRIKQFKVIGGQSISESITNDYSYEHVFNGEDAIGIYALGLNVYHTYGGVGGCNDCTTYYSPSGAYLQALSERQNGNADYGNRVCIQSSCPETPVPVSLQWKSLELECTALPVDCEITIQRTIETPGGGDYYLTTATANVTNGGTVVVEFLTTEDYSGDRSSAGQVWNTRGNAKQFGGYIDSSDVFTSYYSEQQLQRVTQGFSVYARNLRWSTITSIPASGAISTSDFPRELGGVNSKNANIDNNWEISIFVVDPDEGILERGFGLANSGQDVIFSRMLNIENDGYYYDVNFEKIDQHNQAETVTETIVINQSQWDSGEYSPSDGWTIIS